MKDNPVILAVDDQPQNIDLLEAYLVPHGYEIIAAANGEEALEKISGNQIDLILLDVMMPGMDGFEVTRRIRQDNTHRLLPIILITALRETEDRVKGIEAGCDDFISKPFDKMELLARVRSLLTIKAYNDLMINYRKELELTKISADESREYAESIIDTVRESLIVLDQDFRVVTASRSFYEVFKVTPEETVGQLIYDLGNKQWDIPKLRELLETILPQKTTFDNYEVEHDFTTIGRRIMLLNARQIQRAPGDVGKSYESIFRRIMLLNARQMQRVSGEELIILLAIEDITERKEIENGMEKARKELEATKISEDEAREYAESIINTVRESLLVLDQDLRVIKVSRSFCDVFKVNPEETMGQLIYDLGDKQWDIPKLRELLETILPQKATFDNYEVEYDFANIGKRIMLLNARQIQRVLGKERIILLAIEDITERKQSEEKIQQLAFHDSLTGLPNRKLFSDRLGISLANARRSQRNVGIAMLDLDKFKDVNDTLGHDVGDILLKATAERLKSALRKGDTVGRFGGDEFVLILPDLDAIEDVIPVAQKIVTLFRKPFLIDTHQLVVTISIGIAVYPNDGMDEGALLKNADIAMYQAKHAGRAQYRLFGKV